MVSQKNAGVYGPTMNALKRQHTAWAKELIEWLAGQGIIRCEWRDCRSVFGVRHQAGSRGFKEVDMEIGREKAEKRLKVAIQRAAQLGWLQPHPTYGWVMCGAAVEKTIMMALGESQFTPDYNTPVLTTKELCSLIMSAMWDRERDKERRKHTDPRYFRRDITRNTRK